MTLAQLPSGFARPEFLLAAIGDLALAEMLRLQLRAMLVE